MILANKISKLRKQFGWSQEELADKMDVSRQSVSKWESANSIPDLNKIIKLAEIFGVSVDYLVKDEIEEVQTSSEDIEPDVIKVSLDDATQYVRSKIDMSRNISKGVLLCIYSIIPLLLFLAISEGNNAFITTDVASTVGVVLILLLVSIGVRFILRSMQYESDFTIIEEESFELTYGVRSIFKEKAQTYRNIYIQRLSLGVSVIIISVVPLLLVAMLGKSDMLTLLMVLVMIVVVGASVYRMIPSIMEYNAYNCILSEGDYSPKRRKETKRYEKFGEFYWPLITAIYIGWSLWTMDWHITWIIWPVGAIAFAAFVGLIKFFYSDRT